MKLKISVPEVVNIFNSNSNYDFKSILMMRNVLKSRWPKFSIPMFEAHRYEGPFKHDS